MGAAHAATTPEKRLARHDEREILRPLIRIRMTMKEEEGAERYPLTEGDWIKKLSFAKPAGEVEIATGAMSEWSEASRLIH